MKGFEHLDYALAIRRNRDQLRQIVLALFALAGALTSPHSWGEGPKDAKPTERGVPLFLPRSTVAMIMLVLRPAESAVRRLIVIVAQSLKTIPTVPTSARPGGWLISPLAGEMSRSDRGGRAGHKTFSLFDPLKSFDPDSIWDWEPTYESGYSLTKSNPWHDAATDHTPTDATHIAHRLNAILRALNDLPRQARRLKRWELKRDAALKAQKPTRFSPMRPGLPPGWRERRLHEIDDVLKECHRLANDRVSAPNTS